MSKYKLLIIICTLPLLSACISNAPKPVASDAAVIKSY